MEFEKLSCRLVLRSDAPLEVPLFLDRLLHGIVTRLGSDCLGHAKAIAYLPTGRIYASTTG